MAKHILTDATLRNAKPDDKDKRLNDGACTGLIRLRSEHQSSILRDAKKYRNPRDIRFGGFFLCPKQSSKNQ